MEPAKPSISSAGQMGVPFLTDRLTKMITAVEDGPKSSGDGTAVEQLNIQDCRDIREAAANLKIGKNSAVQEVCGDLDDQERRGWLGADTLGVTLIHTYEAPTEAHKVGVQIDNVLTAAKAHVERLRGAARKRKTDQRKKGMEERELAGKLAAIDEKLALDLLEYSRTPVDIELPKVVIEVKRERPGAPPKPEPPPPDGLALAKARVTSARAAFTAASLERQEAECHATRAQKTALRSGWPTLDEYLPNMRGVEDPTVRLAGDARTGTGGVSGSGGADEGGAPRDR